MTRLDSFTEVFNQKAYFGMGDKKRNDWYIWFPDSEVRIYNEDPEVSEPKIPVGLTFYAVTFSEGQTKMVLKNENEEFRIILTKYSIVRWRARVEYGG